MSEARNTAGPAMSSGLPARFSGVWRMTMATMSGFLARASALILVSIRPGPMALTRTPSLPSSAPRPRGLASNPVLAEPGRDRRREAHPGVLGGGVGGRVGPGPMHERLRRADI